MRFKRPPLRIQPTTLWDYPSQDYGDAQQGRPGYKGATPSYIIWNLLQRYTKEKELVVDPFAGSGTTLAVAKRLRRRYLGIELSDTYAEAIRERLLAVRPEPERPLSVPRRPGVRRTQAAGLKPR